MKKRHKVIVRQAAKHANAIKAAIAASFSVDQVVNAWVDANHHPDTTTQQARDWARTNVLMTSAGISGALASLYADAWVLGKDVSSEAIAQASIAAGAEMTPEFRVALSIGWDNWTPGNRAAAALANPEGGLSRLLETRDIKIRGFEQTTYDRLGTILGNALTEGKTPAMIADQIRPLLESVNENPNRAFTIANTEMGRAINDAQRQSYLDAGVEKWQWNVVDPQDEDCQSLDGEIVVIGEPFSNGWVDKNDSHPNCMCDTAPYVDLLLDNTDDSEKAMKPEFARPATAGVPGSQNVKRALNRLSILPNPPEADIEDIDRYVESPWPVIPTPTVDPNNWDNAKIVVINIIELHATDPFMGRKKVKHHIKSMGQALTPNRSYPLVAVVDGVATIMDGHHRLLAMWLLGLDQAPVWLIKE